ncbi:MAG: hypothetical protein Tsb0034_04870 [Ekhidna sp.]
MNYRNALIISLTFLFNITIAQEPAKVDIDLLKGDQPKLLSMMASTSGAYEQLNGSSLNVGTLLGGWHAQAVGQYKEYVYVAFSDGKLLDAKTIQTKKDQSTGFSKMWIYNTKTQQGKLVNLESGYPHPCSIQVTGRYLAVVVEAAYGTNQEIGIERQEKSVVLIYDLEKDPNCGVEAGRIVQDGMNSGGAGLAYSPQAKCWYMLVDQDVKSNKGVVIYKTKDSNINSWQKEPIAKYRRFGSGAGLNLVTASDNSIWGLYYDAAHDGLPTFSQWEVSADEVKLFKLIEPNGTPVAERVVYSQIVNISSPKLKTAGELLADRPGMRFGAGLRIEGGNMELLMCQRNMDKVFNISRTPIKPGNRTQVFFTNLSQSRGELGVVSTSNSSQTAKVQRMQTESWNGVFQSPVKCDLNYMPLSLKSFGSLSKPKWSDALDATSSAPLVLFYLEGSGSITGKKIEFSAQKITDKKIN